MLLKSILNLCGKVSKTFRMTHGLASVWPPTMYCTSCVTPRSRIQGSENATSSWCHGVRYSDTRRMCESFARIISPCACLCHKHVGPRHALTCRKATRQGLDRIDSCGRLQAAVASTSVLVGSLHPCRCVNSMRFCQCLQTLPMLPWQPSAMHSVVWGSLPEALHVSGCKDKSISMSIKGIFEISGSNHGKLVFKKIATANVQAIGPRVDANAFIYYWDERDGPDFAGWWIGSEVGGTKTQWGSTVWSVWSHNAAVPPARWQAPPSSGWKAPWNGCVDETLIVTVAPRAPAPPRVLALPRPPPPPPAQAAVCIDQQEVPKEWWLLFRDPMDPERVMDGEEIYPAFCAAVNELTEGSGFMHYGIGPANGHTVQMWLTPKYRGDGNVQLFTSWRMNQPGVANVRLSIGDPSLMNWVHSVLLLSAWFADAPGKNASMHWYYEPY